MGQSYETIDDVLATWIAAQKLFFVATAPTHTTGLVNCSPKGGDTLRVLGPKTIAFLDGLGSGIETIAHVRDNARIVVMLCAFEGSPRIVRLHGRGEIVDSLHSDFDTLLAKFALWPTVRAIVRIAVDRISDSCGYGVPLMDYRGERTDSANYVAKASDASLRKYVLQHNQRSLDGLPGLTPEAIAGVVIHR